MAGDGSCVSRCCQDAFASGSCAADIVRRHISRHAERKVLDILQIDRARSVSGIQVRKPLSIACGDPRLKSALIAMEHNSDGSQRLRQFLGQSQAPLAEIAFDLGFDNSSHFARLFKRLYDVPPGRFRDDAPDALADETADSEAPD